MPRWQTLDVAAQFVSDITGIFIAAFGSSSSAPMTLSGGTSAPLSCDGAKGYRMIAGDGTIRVSKSTAVSSDGGNEAMD